MLAWWLATAFWGSGEGDGVLWRGRRGVATLATATVATASGFPHSLPFHGSDTHAYTHATYTHAHMRATYTQSWSKHTFARIRTRPPHASPAGCGSAEWLPLPAHSPP